jgi:tetratricopeptide (TPR) repeat protein
MLTAGAVLLLVLRPLAADQEARRGLELAPRDPEAALAAHRRSVELGPWREVLWLRLGATSHAAGVASGSDENSRDRLDLARRSFERATALAPPDPYAHMRLAGTLAELARRGQVPGAAAIASADQALLLDPNNAHFYVAAVNIALVAGDVGRAKAYALDCLERYPRFGAPRFLLGRIALQAGRTEEAVREMEAALQGEWYGDSVTRDYVAGELERVQARMGREQVSAGDRAAPPQAGLRATKPARARGSGSAP